MITSANLIRILHQHFIREQGIDILRRKYFIKLGNCSYAPAIIGRTHQSNSKNYKPFLPSPLKLKNFTTKNESLMSVCADLASLSRTKYKFEINFCVFD